MFCSPFQPIQEDSYCTSNPLRALTATCFQSFGKLLAAAAELLTPFIDLISTAGMAAKVVKLLLVEFWRQLWGFDDGR